MPSRYEVIIAVREHSFLGYLLYPCVVEHKPNIEFFEIVEIVHTDTLRNYLPNPTDALLQICKLADEFDDARVVSVFSKEKKRPIDFFVDMTKEYAEERVLPYIERRLVKIIELLPQCGVRIFYRRTEHKTMFEQDLVSIPQQKASAIFNFLVEETQTRYFLSVHHNGKEINLTGSKAIVLTNEPCYMVIRNQLLGFPDIDGKKLSPFMKKAYVSVPFSAEKKYFEKFVWDSIKYYNIKASGFSIETREETKHVELSLEYDLRGDLVFVIFFYYGELKTQPSDSEPAFVDFVQRTRPYKYVKIPRDLSWENEQCQMLQSLGLRRPSDNIFKAPDTAQSQHCAAIEWLYANLTHLQSKNIDIKQRIEKKPFFIGTCHLQLEINEDNDWFDVHATVHFGNHNIPFLSLSKHIKNGTREFELPDGSVAIIPEEWFARYKSWFMLGKAKGDVLKIGKPQFALLQQSDVLPKDLYAKLTALSEKTIEQLQPSANLRATLRHYQTEGLSWMWALQQSGFGGCLADDMGLGKTLQTIALLQHNYDAALQNAADAGQQLSLFDIPTPKIGNSLPPSLVVVPASLVHNWIAEIRRFAPRLKVTRYTGNQRNETGLNNTHVIVTTYGVVRNDTNRLANKTFLYLVADESQNIKNPQSKSYKAISSLQALYRLTLTGTPIENSLTDLWAQMNFLNPHLLGSQRSFKQHFAKGGGNDSNLLDMLRRIVSPFILRRTKEQAAPELPELTTQVLYCSMNKEQRSLYETEKSKIRNSLMGLMDTNEQKNQLQFHVLQGLMRLRQIACHPRMIDDTWQHDAGKFDDVWSTIENLIAERRKVLVFSSFVKHLTLFSKHCETKKIKYAMLTGKTQNREAVIARFANNTDVPLFFISLKAGGTGLNLTQADYVLILDPWWNPAAEEQAIARSHRIGQTNHVFAYRFVTRDTVEEKIMKLKKRKSDLARKLISDTDTVVTLDDIKYLFD